MALSLIPSSSSNTCQSKYDVFLSFRGGDTRNKFTSHLHRALDDKKIKTYIDYELKSGDKISPSLLKAIEESQVSIIIFSQDYASSRWCIEELVKILECRQNHQQIVIPVFYEIDPSDVRYQSGRFAVALVKHQKRTCNDKVQRWKDALNEAANLSGFNSRDYNFVDCFKLDQNIFEDIVKDALLYTKQVFCHASLHYPGSEIPKCFAFRNEGSFINVELPPNWFNNNFLGFAYCVVVMGHPIDFEKKGSFSSISWKCNFKYKDGQDQRASGQNGYVYSNHVFMCSYRSFSLQELLCYKNEVSFEFHLYSSSLKIEKCGVHLIFGEEVDRSSWVGEDEDGLSLANVVHDDCEENIEGDTQLIKNIDLKLLIDIFNGITSASARGKNIVAKAPRKGALSRRKPLGDLSNSIQPTPNRSIKKQNSSMFSFTEKETGAS
ncbi:hypothetical protein Dsin_014504 [Dipteronia sinensis]|uniref:ADP-ribosyl cyclase/cyclic ADP-ribose hydrolase n=1 Tax=Dipteronia sinensis TaxID=43782 RepID=A0AAE0AN62_9ROSI|nr:hypothetical protein Dsin_014504 [Dipteronia sinensis]